jgi:hypothetical protein
VPFQRRSGTILGRGIVDVEIVAGIPFFSSTTTESSSTLLVSDGIVLGGGTDAAPNTIPALTYASSSLNVGYSGQALSFVLVQKLGLVNLNARRMPWV